MNNCGTCKSWVKNDSINNLPCWQKREYSPCLNEWQELANISKNNGGDGWACVPFYTANHLCHRREYKRA